MAMASAIGNMIPMLGELLMEKYNPHKRVKKCVKFLRNELETMHPALVTVGEVLRPSSTNKSST